MELSDIKKVGPKTLTYLNNLGIYNIDDLINYYPYRYEIIKRSNMDEVSENDKVIIDGVVESNPTIFYYGKRKNVMNFRINIGSRLIGVSIYNRGFLKNKIIIGNYVTIIGKMVKGKIIATDIRFSKLPDKTEVDVIYHESNNINSKELREFIKEAIKDYKAKDYLPENIIKKYDFLDKYSALLEIHNPSSSIKLKKAINLLKYEELFLFMFKIVKLKLSRTKVPGLKRSVDKKNIDSFINSFPFELTKDQIKAVDDIYNDMTKGTRMNRLVQGDVGSGKTVIAFVALYINYLSGYQGALMAPTEVLANQHFINIKKFIKNVNIEILTGSTKKSDKKKIVEKLKNKEIDIIIGTHALFSEDVNYNNLGLVITDEQHRFGVNQRASLKNKGITPDILYLSATPIPRTYALTIYGDMDISNIKTVPSGKLEIITLLKKSDEIKDVLSMMYKEILNKHQIYVIAPLTEENEDMSLEDVKTLKNKMEKAFSKVANIELMYGKMKQKDKDKIMSEFKEGKIDILVSTTVIEVGVDVKNATMIVIFDSDRFGLSTLHQLRGRVGRNDIQSYCILMCDKEKERLKIMTETSDGFKISEEDFKLRGSGDLFGNRQSGDMNFKLADIKRDFKMLLSAKEDSLEYINNIDYNDKIKSIIEKSDNLD